MYLLIKYIKSVLWRVVKRLCCIEEARCLKVKDIFIICNIYLCIGWLKQQQKQQQQDTHGTCIIVKGKFVVFPSPDYNLSFKNCPL